MATPVFISTLSSVKASLRLSGVTDGDSLQLIQDAVDAVRIQIYDYLGVTRIDQVKAIPLVSNPATADQIMRTRGNAVELLMIRRHLLRTMPMLFQNAVSQARQAWQEEGLVRDSSSRELDKELARLDSEISTGLTALAGVTPVDNGVNVSVIGPACTNRPPGSFIYS